MNNVDPIPIPLYSYMSGDFLHFNPDVGLCIGGGGGGVVCRL